MRYEIFDINGRIVMNVKLNNREAIRVNHLANGDYLIKSIDEKMVQTSKKFTKE